MRGGRAGLLIVALAHGLTGQPAPTSRVATALAMLHGTAVKIHDDKIRNATLDGLAPNTCIAHRAGLSEADKNAILKKLRAEGLLDGTGAMEGIFPPVREDSSACPKLPQRFEGAPGSNFGGHHSYPGGLAIHESFNLSNALGLANEYRFKYGPDVPIDEDLLIAAPIWHDWAKTIVFQWKPDGTEFEEFAFGGSAKIASKTGAHHILSLAETIKRGLPADLIVAQASAHAAPVLGNEFKVVNWIRAASIIAGVDPIAKGYLVRNAGGEWHIAKFRPEDSIHNMSDADYVLSIPALATIEGVLKQLAHEFGFDPADTARYNNQFRNRVLSSLTAERLFFVYSQSGTNGLRAEIKQKSVF